jgi:hypothetical protein
MQKQIRLSRRPVLISATIVAAFLAVSIAPSFAMASSDAGVGKHAYKFNVIGHPGVWNGDDSNANTKTLFMSLDSVEGDSSICEDSGVTVIDDQPGTNVETTEPTAGQRLRFTGTTDGSFYVIDRDLTDGSGHIAIPATSGTGGYDVYVRVLGKPGGCLDADGYTEFDSDGDGVIDQWLFSGHLDANRKTGVPGKTLINDMFDVWVCVAWSDDGLTCLDYDEVSVFSDMFEGYFWQIQNDGLRNMQLIFVEV